MTKETAMRFNEGKMRFDLIPIELDVELARVYTVGAIKYDDGNWMKGMKWSVMIECAERHWKKWQSGLTVDPDTGCHHLALAIWNLAGLMVYQMRGLGEDNRNLVPLDEDFKWTEGPAGAMGLGLSKEKLAEMEAKYRPQREAARAKMAEARLAAAKVQADQQLEVASELAGVKIDGILGKLNPLVETNFGLNILPGDLDGKLDVFSGMETEGSDVYCFLAENDGAARLHNIEVGDILFFFDTSDNNALVAETVTRRFTSSLWPNSKLTRKDFHSGKPAYLRKKK